MSAAASSGAAAAAARKRRARENEEEMNQPSDPQFEFKIIRSSTHAFKNPDRLRAILDEEAKAGWEICEKFDDARVRLRRSVDWREKDSLLDFDPYRTQIGIGEGAIAAVIACSIIFAMILVLLVVLALAR